ncbi:hypothetical protein GGQ84_001614 [Desulfitispora alkaliphila]
MSGVSLVELPLWPCAGPLCCLCAGGPISDHGLNVSPAAAAALFYGPVGYTCRRARVPLVLSFAGMPPSASGSGAGSSGYVMDLLVFPCFSVAVISLLVVFLSRIFLHWWYFCRSYSRVSLPPVLWTVRWIVPRLSCLS